MKSYTAITLRCEFGRTDRVYWGTTKPNIGDGCDIQFGAPIVGYIIESREPRRSMIDFQNGSRIHIES